MKTRLLLLSLITGISFTFAQNQLLDFNGNKSDQPRDPRADQMNFVPNEVIVKFKEAVPVAAGDRLKAAGVSSVDKLLQSHGITTLEKLFPVEKKQLSPRMMRSPRGIEFKVPALDKIYKVSLPPLQSTDSIPVNIFQLIEELKALPEVEYAEPNYIYSIDEMQPAGPVLTAEDVAKLQQNIRKSTTIAVIPNDPLYGQQWYIPAVKADSVWQQTTGDTTQVIAILDTGVDWNHPDLKNKIWINKNEIPDNGIDDDNNGLIDDVRGWDYINNDNNPTDDNSHGTHVAGIAAAETNNGIGIAGVNWKAKIMPIKVFQSSGRGDAATITKGIIFAATHGAIVINMSFGSYARSLAMEDALANAYATSILVAAAGNDNLPIGPGKALKCDEINAGAPFYPAALQYVLGVEAPDGCFSNYDQDGSTFSAYTDLLNYEMKAPGTNILSTVPNGNYRVFQGTSMAAPVVSAAVCLYKSKHIADSQELMWGNLINSTNTYFNISSAINIVPTPKLMFVSKTLVDTLAGDNKNGLINAGETIQIWFNVRNTWGQCDSVQIKLKFGELEDNTIAQILTSTALIGSVSPYATSTNAQNPFIIHFNQNIAHERDIAFTAYLYYPNSADTIKQNFTLNIQNGQEISKLLTDTLVLTPDKLWLVNGSFKIAPSGVLVLKPGTHLIINSKIVNDGTIIANGSPDSTISITGTELTNGNFFGDHVVLNLSLPFSTAINFKNGKLKNSVITINDYTGRRGYWWDSNFTFEDCIFTNCNTVEYFFMYSSYIFIRCDFYSINSSSVFYGEEGAQGVKLIYCNFNKVNTLIRNSDKKEIYRSNFLDNNEIPMYYSPSNVYLDTVTSIYWGTNDSVKISKKIFDFFDDASHSQTIFQPVLIAPSDSAHAITWKVLVNGKDAQDEYIEPLGVGKHRFDVYFNRPMNKSIIPLISFGVKYPYNQQIVNEDGVWSEDGKIYNAFKTIRLTTGDGMNQIRVSGAKDQAGWEIPVEDMRFRFLISAASSSSLEFTATAGLGKVNLEWNNSDLADGLGYNMYRMLHINDSTLTVPVMINSSLIADTVYTDFNVTPNKKYYYYYKIVRTDLSETDSSRVVSAIPFTASKGDANGDLSVNVLDITSIVAYLLNNNPQPFISEAADMNSDGNINVLDIVGVVNKILNIPQGAPRIALNQQVDLYLQNDTLFADATGPIGGIQLDLSGVSSIDDIQVLQPLQGFESGYGVTTGGLRLLYYSMSGKSIPGGNCIPLLKMKAGSTIADAIFSETNGSPIKVNYILTRIGNISNNMNQTVAESGQNYPNPVNGKTIIPVRIYEPVDEVVLRVVNMVGQQVDMIRLTNPYIGEHLLQWNPAQNKGLFVYILEIRNGKQKLICPVRKMIVQ